ncbi:TIGR03066 family protein [Gemmata sp.]|uniref:TIGR03066 family protein n=1 Tax=Gemmata sp. TaxID=1914242 RepID=UPI003F724432
MRAVLCAVVVLGFAGATAAGQDQKIDAKKLIGKWEAAKAKEGAPKMVVEFAEAGKVTLTVTVGDKSEKIDGTYKVDGNKVEVVMALGGKEEKETFTVSKLTDDEMVSKDSKGKEETLKKVKAK